MAKLTAKRAKAIADKTKTWFQGNKRDLPWRGATPYGVWVSEIMLQQTQVATATPYYLRFMERFPSLETLAETPIEEVLRYWAGLGYYARARNLHRAAQIVVQTHGGVVPQSPQAMEALPGIGKYTAGAVLSIAYGIPRPIVDANVIRVLSRLFALRGDPKSSTNQAILWELAGRLVPQASPGDFNQGLMELGSLVCTPIEPKCHACPLHTECDATKTIDPTAFPEIPAGKATVRLTHASALICNATGGYLLVQRPLEGLWGGLWEFPRVPMVQGETPAQAAGRAGREVAGLECEIGAQVGKITHSVTHHRITLYGFAARPKDGNDTPTLGESRDARWALPEEWEGFALSAPQVLLRNALKVFLERGGVAQGALPFGEDV